MSNHCRHCPGEDDPRHLEPGYTEAESACAFYEDTEHLRIAAESRSVKRRMAEAAAEMTRLGQEIGDPGIRVCLTHHSVNVCRHAGVCSWSADPEDVKVVTDWHEG